jgi:hypothetical protein
MANEITPKGIAVGLVLAWLIALAVALATGGCEVCTDDATFGSSCDPRDAGARDGGGQ